VARAAFGAIEPVPLSDGTVSIRGRFSYQGERYRIVFGRDVDGWTTARASQEMQNVRVLLRAGVPIDDVLRRFGPALAEIEDSASDMTFHEYASDWYRRRCSGELGDRPPAQATREHYLWALSHLLVFLAEMPVAKIAKRDCERFRGKLFSDSEELRVLIAAGGHPTYENGQRRKPLSLRSIRSIMVLLAQILEDAVEDELRTDNPARSKRLRVRVPKPRRTFLEIDQLVALLDAAGELERTPKVNKRSKLTLKQAEQIRSRIAGGESQYALSREYGLSSSTMSMLAQGKTYRGESGRIGWRAFCAVLGYAGPRISEALDLHEGDLRLHDPEGSRLWIPDSKTDTGIRHVEISPALRDELLAYRAEKIRRGYPTTVDTPLFCTAKGTRWDADNVRQSLLSPVVRLASRRLTERGLPPLPHVTPHSLRRTYVSIMLLATNFDIPFVQSQVGHASAKMTLDVYNQLLDRSKREHGAAFDALLRDARTTLYGPAEQRETSDLAHQLAHRPQSNPRDIGGRGLEPADLQALLEGERGDSNPRPPGPQPGALPTELRPPGNATIAV
jgi:integrase